MSRSPTPGAPQSAAPVVSAATKASAAAFQTGLAAFAKGYTEHTGTRNGAEGSKQSRKFTLSDSSNWREAFLIAGKFKATDLYWLQPVTVSPDGHAHASFELVLFS